MSLITKVEFMSGKKQVSRLRVALTKAGDVVLVLLLALSVPLAGICHAQEKDGKMRKPLPSSEEINALPADGGDEFNRLIHEKSPYLLQHARNPVDWFPWGDNAFARAKREDKPIFLSIGYSTCHWCHVMERESFENDEVAKLLNQYFVCIKVDREERPDIDGIYMTVCQMLTKSGGWPLTIVMTPEKKPFFAGTYFPRQSAYGRSGMMELIPTIGKAWKTRRDDINKSADEITDGLKQASEVTAKEKLRPELLNAARLRLMSGNWGLTFSLSQRTRSTAPKESGLCM